MTAELAAPYPWHGAPWEALVAQRQAGILPHALLVVGAADIGKLRFAQAFAALMLCLDARGSACGHCRSCRLLAAGSHPDLMSLQPEERGKAIRIDAVRELREFCAGRPHQGGWRVILIEPADALNVNAANALLKTLEEPGERTLLLLVSALPGRLPATVRSRCRLLRLATPAPAQALPWLRERVAPETDAQALLAQSEGRPLRALELAAGDLGKRIARLQALAAAVTEGSLVPAGAAAATLDTQLETLDILDWFGERVAASARTAVTGRRVPPQALFEFRDRLTIVRREHAANANLNAELLWEGLWQDWRRATVG